MSKEIVKKPFYKKWWFWAILVVVILGPIFSSMEDDEQAEDGQSKEVEKKEENPIDNEEPQEETEEEESSDKTIELEDEFMFANFTVYMDEARIYEEGGQTYMDISFDWLNNSFDDRTTFMSAAGIDVHQGEQLLDETSDAYNDKQSDVYFPNAVGGQIGVNLTYELIDSENQVRIVFVPWDEYDDTEELIIDIK